NALWERYPFIRDFVEMDCKSNKGIAQLGTVLRREVECLKWVHDPFPQSWDAVRRALVSGPQKRSHLSYSEFRELCGEHGVENAGQQDSLAEVLHNLGVAL